MDAKQMLLLHCNNNIPKLKKKASNTRSDAFLLIISLSNSRHINLPLMQQQQPN